MAVRLPAVAGVFYPADPAKLYALVRRLLAEARPGLALHGCPAALILPHAGYLYSGPVAASGYVCLEGWRGAIGRVLLIGPSHHASFDGLAASSASAFRTPAGVLPVAPVPAAVAAAHGIAARDRAHAPEHSLEVQLPFLAEMLGEVPIIPLLTGGVPAAAVAAALQALWEPGTLVIVSSDLSHYLSWEEARQRDAATAAAIERLDVSGVHAHDACGHIAVQALLLAAHTRKLEVHVADLRNSGDTSGRRNEVVGYGAFLFTPGGAS